MNRLLALAGAAAAAALLAATAAPAGASAFYNEVDSGQPDPAVVVFSCGVFCNNTFKIAPGGNASRPGKAGSFVLWGDIGFTGQKADACQLNTLEVEDHGWGQLEDPDDDYRWLVFSNNGSQVSGSPFGVQFGEFFPGNLSQPASCFRP